MIIDERYRVVRLLGQGGMGAVYECSHVGTRRPFAVKVILPDAARGPQAFERFMREASAQGAVKSPFVVDISDVGIDRVTRGAFMAMEMLKGEDLSKRIERAGKIAPELVLRIAAQGLTGLAAAHAAGVIHRDLKPANLFLAKTGKGERTAKLLDFGIAKVLEDDSPHSGKLTKTGMIFGSPSYMSPEQASGGPNVDHLSDVWSFGAIMYEALTGAPPYHDARSLQELIKRIWVEPPQPLATRAPYVPAEVAAIVTKAMTHDRAGRYQSAEEMRAAVMALLPGGFAITDAMLGIEDAPTPDPTSTPAVSAVSGASGGSAISGAHAVSGVPSSPNLAASGSTGRLSDAGSAAGGTQAMPASAVPSGSGPTAAAQSGIGFSPLAGAQVTDSALSRTVERPGSRRTVLYVAITAVATVGLALLVLQFIPKPATQGSGAANGGDGPGSANVPAAQTTASAGSTAATVTAAVSGDQGAAAASTGADPSTAASGAADAGAASARPGAGLRGPVPKTKATDPFSGKPISKEDKP